jgi:magnesium transporter
MSDSSITDFLRRALNHPIKLRKPPADAYVAGNRPGIEGIPDTDTPPKPGSVGIELIDFGPSTITRQEFGDIETALASPRSEDQPVRWINIDGLHPYVINHCRKVLDLHTLHAEDVLHVPQRPRVEAEDGHLFIIARMLMANEEVLIAEQISFFLFPGLLLTIQERPGDVWGPIRDRLQKTKSRVRTHGADFLAYALLDAIVDHNFPLLEHYGDNLEMLEDEILVEPNQQRMQRLYTIKRDLLTFRRMLWPMREVIDTLRRGEEDSLLSGETRRYLTDVNEHLIQIIEVLESYREMASSLTDLYMSSVSNRMNEVMKVLTIMAAFFIPITFVAGVYGMNFEHMPELKMRWAYPCFWAVTISITVGLFVTFKRRNWL